MNTPYEQSSIETRGDDIQSKVQPWSTSRNTSVTPSHFEIRNGTWKRVFDDVPEISDPTTAERDTP